MIGLFFFILVCLIIVTFVLGLLVSLWDSACFIVGDWFKSLVERRYEDDR